MLQGFGTRWARVCGWLGSFCLFPVTPHVCLAAPLCRISVSLSSKHSSALLFLCFLSASSCSQEPCKVLRSFRPSAVLPLHLLQSMCSFVSAVCFVVCRLLCLMWHGSTVWDDNVQRVLCVTSCAACRRAWPFPHIPNFRPAPHNAGTSSGSSEPSNSRTMLPKPDCPVPTNPTHIAASSSASAVVAAPKTHGSSVCCLCGRGRGTVCGWPLGLAIP